MFRATYPRLRAVSLMMALREMQSGCMVIDHGDTMTLLAGCPLPDAEMIADGDDEIDALCDAFDAGGVKWGSWLKGQTTPVVTPQPAATPQPPTPQTRVVGSDLQATSRVVEYPTTLMTVLPGYE